MLSSGEPVREGNEQAFAFPNLLAINFAVGVLLGDGVVASLRSDPRPRALASTCAQRSYPSPSSLLESSSRLEGDSLLESSSRLEGD